MLSVITKFELILVAVWRWLFQVFLVVLNHFRSLISVKVAQRSHFGAEVLSSCSHQSHPSSLAFVLSRVTFSFFPLVRLVVVRPAGIGNKLQNKEDRMRFFAELHLVKLPSVNQHWDYYLFYHVTSFWLHPIVNVFCHWALCFAYCTLSNIYEGDTIGTICQFTWFITVDT